MHHILNMYRPHQARESAIELLQARLDQTRAETATIRSRTEMARKALEGLASIEAPKAMRSVFADADAREAEVARTMERVDRAVWAAMDDL